MSEHTEREIEAVAVAIRKACNTACGSRAVAKAAIDALDRARDARSDTVVVEDAREVLLRIGERVMTFGGFQRTPRGEFWVSRDDVLRLVDDLLAEFGGRAATDDQAP